MRVEDELVSDDINMGSIDHPTSGSQMGGDAFGYPNGDAVVETISNPDSVGLRQKASDRMVH